MSNAQGAPDWPTYDEASDQNMVFALSPSTQKELKKDACDFWDSLSP